MTSGLPIPPRATVPVPPAAPGEKLIITKDELLFMQQIAPLFGHTPRTINRYVNIYRIIKAHGALRVQGTFEKDESYPIMFVLGIIVGYSDCAEAFLQKLMSAKDDQPVQEFVKGCGMESLKAAATPLLGNLGTMHVKYLKQNLPLIARFSFRTLLKEGV